MFNLILNTMYDNDPDSYSERLDFLFREFIDLKYVIDPEHEADVVSWLIYNLAARVLCRHNTYINIIWNQAYGCEMFDIEPTNEYTARDYAEQIETMIKIYSVVTGGELELIRMLVCYAKSKKLDIKNHFLEVVKKLEIKEKT